MGVETHGILLKKRTLQTVILGTGPLCLYVSLVMEKLVQEAVDTLLWIELLNFVTCGGLGTQSDCRGANRFWKKYSVQNAP